MKVTTFPLCTTLPTLENALLWSMRAWVIGHVHGQTISDRIAELFNRLNAPIGAGFLDGFMWALSSGTSRTLEVNCVCHPDISQDEATLLNIISLEQHGQHEDAYALLTGMTIAEAAAAIGSSCANRLALILANAGQIMSRRVSGGSASLVSRISMQGQAAHYYH